MNKVIKIAFADHCELVWEGTRYVFDKDKPVEVPFSLADRLLQSGDFVDVVNFPAQPAAAPEAIPSAEPKELPAPVKEALAKKKTERVRVNTTQGKG